MAMPSSQRSSQLSSSAKKQQSIASFFTRAGTAQQCLSPEPPASLPTEKWSTGPSAVEIQEHGLFVSDDEESPVSRKESRNSKRALDTDADSLENEIGSANLPSRKRSRKSNTPNPDNQLKSRATSETLHPITANEVKKPKVSERTSKYLFSSSPAGEEALAEDDEETRTEKGRLHQKFVKKLGRPDSIAEIRRRKKLIMEDTVEEEGGDNDEAEEDEPTVKPVRGKTNLAKKGGVKQTPLQKQVIEIKQKYPDTLLVVEVGYKYRFFGEDARVAAKELSIVCIPGKYRFDNHPSEAHIDGFASASIPVPRLHVHVKRLVAAGHKVGVVRQRETAALKAAGENRNAPFVRELTSLYTKGTYIDDVEDLKGEGLSKSPATGYLLCITESKAKGSGIDDRVHVGIVAVQPATGDVIYDDFEDGFMRSEIETRLLHLAPVEFLIVGEVSKPTDRLVQHLSGSKTNVFGDRARVERVERTKKMTAQAYSHISNFYAGKMKASGTEMDSKRSALLDEVLKLAEHVTICLSAMITHLSDYGLEHVFDLTKYFQSFSARSHMLLNGTALTSLEIYQNQTDQSRKGSLFWTLDRTRTRFGQRLLRKWVGRPLLDRSRLEERIAAVEELKDGQQATMIDRLGKLLYKVQTDLEKSLIRIYYGKCTRPELLNVLQTMQNIATEFASVKTIADAGFQSNMINEAIMALPGVLDDVIQYLEKINPQAAKDDDKYAFFRENEETEGIEEHKLGIAGVEHELDQHRTLAAEKVKRKKVDFVTVAGIEYLIEIENTQLKNVPASWAKISGTKKVSRFHTPEVVRLIRERDQHKESLAAACDAAFTALLADIASKYQSFRDCVQALATLDCLVSLATVAAQPGYVKPEYTEETCIVVEKGRHPMVEQLLLDAYVPNDIALETDGTRALLITGPNMGGKSSYVRQVALIAIMGQIGSYVPAASTKLGMLDAVFTRMGAFDNMMAGESTFMVELSETSDILKQASSKSLIILDELGRGTSTHDGVAIAQAVLDHVVRETKSLTLFITHYQNLSAMARAFPKQELRNVHMKFTENGTGAENITFLYEVGDGVAHRSYG